MTVPVCTVDSEDLEEAGFRIQEARPQNPQSSPQTRHPLFRSLPHTTLSLSPSRVESKVSLPHLRVMAHACPVPCAGEMRSQMGGAGPQNACRLFRVLGAGAQPSLTSPQRDCRTNRRQQNAMTIEFCCRADQLLSRSLSPGLSLSRPLARARTPCRFKFPRSCSLFSASLAHLLAPFHPPFLPLPPRFLPHPSDPPPCRTLALCPPTLAPDATTALARATPGVRGSSATVAGAMVAINSHRPAAFRQPQRAAAAGTARQRVQMCGIYKRMLSRAALLRSEINQADNIVRWRRHASGGAGPPDGASARAVGPTCALMKQRYARDAGRGQGSTPLLALGLRDRRAVSVRRCSDGPRACALPGSRRALHRVHWPPHASARVQARASRRGRGQAGARAAPS